MKTFKRVKRSFTETVEQSHTCDLCEKEIITEDGVDRDEVTISRRSGECYPEWEGDNTRLKFTDCCGECFESEVIPTLEAIGFVFRERRLDDAEETAYEQ